MLSAIFLVTSQSGSYRRVTRMSAQSTVKHFLSNVKLRTAQGNTPVTPPTGVPIGLYFGSSWCPDCYGGWVQHLNSFYQRVNESGKKKFEVVYVTSDNNKAQFEEVMARSHGPWLAIEYGEAAIPELKKLHKVCAAKEASSLGVYDRRSGIPALVIVNESGQVIDFDGVASAQNLRPEDCLKRWGVEV